GLFQGFGIELEYMIVDRSTLAVRPVADELLRAVTGAYADAVDWTDTAWSNELVAHVIELKTQGPRAPLAGIAAPFAADVARINDLPEPLEAMLLPTAMHPWMDPRADTRLWPHGDATIYQTYDRIFGCQGHGWSNLQSMHLNLPFA